MKIVVLTIRLIKQRIKNILILAAEMALSCLVLLGVLGIILDNLKCKELAEALTSENNYYFIACECYDSSFDITECFPESERVNITFSQMKIVFLNSENYGNIRGLSYDDFLWKAMKLSGNPEEFDQYVNSGYIPAIGCDTFFKTGDIVVDEVGNEIYIFDTYSSEKKLFLFSHSSSKNIFNIKSLISEESLAKLIIPQQFLSEDWSIHNSYISPCGVVSIDANPQKKQEMVEYMAKYGSVDSMNILYTNFSNDYRLELITNVTLLLVFTITAMVGTIGINGLWLKKNEKKFAIMYIAGMNRKTNRLIVLFENMLIFILGFAVFIVIYVLFRDTFVPFDFGNALIPAILAIFVFLALIFGITTYCSFNDLKKKKLIEIYKRDNYGY